MTSDTEPRPPAADTEEYDVEPEQPNDELAPAPGPDPEFTADEVADMTQGMGPDPDLEE
jgi:hypothetical protein